MGENKENEGAEETEENEKNKDTEETEESDHSSDGYESDNNDDIEFDDDRIDPKRVTSFRILLDALNSPNCSLHAVLAKNTTTIPPFFATI